MKKILLIVLAATVLLLGLSTWAYAATPQDIYDDYTDNGVLDGTYTDAELRAYLNNATLHQYPPDATAVKSLDAYIRGLLSGRDRFPCTGFEVVLMVAGAAALLGIGLGLRRLSRSRA